MSRSRTAYTSSLFRVGLKLCPKLDSLAKGKHGKSIPPVYHMPKNRPHGIRAPYSKSLTEALLCSPSSK